MKKFKLSPDLGARFLKEQAAQINELPIRAPRTVTGHPYCPDFDNANHAAWYRDMLSLADYLLTCKEFTVKIDSRTIVCDYINASGTGHFCLSYETALLSPLQRKILLHLFEKLSLL